MTKQPQFVSKLRLSRLCRWILVLGTVKLCLLASLVLMPSEPESGAFGLMGNTAARAASPFSTEPAAPAGQAPAQANTTGMRGALPSGLTGATGATGANGESGMTASTSVPVPPAPRIASGQASPFAQNLPEYTRPDEAVPPAPPSPTITPMVPRDSAARKQEELNRREQELLALQQQMQSRLDELKKIEGNVQTMLKQADTSQDDKLRHLVDVYSNMKARQAAEVLTNLDERIAVKILTGMRGRQAGEILTYMNAEKAAKLSEALTRTQLPR